VTCIIGFIDSKEKKMYMGGDTALTAPDLGDKTVVKGYKVLKRGDMLLGISGSNQLLHIIKYRFKCPVKEKGRNDELYLNVDLIDYIKELIVVDMYERESGNITVCYKGILVNIAIANNTDVEVEEISDNYTVAGCGDIARGVMDLGLQHKIPIKKLIKEAIIITANHNAFVNKKCKILELPY